MLNNNVELHGFLGQDAKLIESEKSKFVTLSLATTDSYKDSEGNWKDKETQWHEVLVFRPVAIQFAKDFKKGDSICVFGSLNYKEFKDENGYKKHEVAIIARFVEKKDLNSKEA